MNWQPLIKEPGSTEFKSKITGIAGALTNNIAHFPDNNGIDGEKLATALFLFYYSRLTGETAYADQGLDLISGIFEALNRDLETGAFERSSTALAGLGWIMEHLKQNGFIDIDTDEMLADVDGLLHQVMMIDMQKRRYDYIYGAIHKGIYFLNRLEKPGVRAYLEELVDLVGQVSNLDERGGRCFLVDMQERNGHSGVFCDLGLAHGMPQVAWFLGKLIKHGVAVNKTTALLKEFVAYILNRSQDIGQFKSYFPTMVIDEGMPANSRLAWCYGDPGIGISLWQAGQDSANSELSDQAVKILLHSSQRRDLSENGVVDAGICHGTAGLAQIFNRMYHYTENEDFRQAAQYWATETLKMSRFDDGYGGFKCWKGDDDGGWINAANLFDGASGIGLALVSLVSDIPPHWDRMLLLS